MVAPQSGTPKKLIILLHGYGSDGRDLISLATYWQPVAPDAIFLAPNGPFPCDINPQGFQWFPLELDRAISRLENSGQARPIIEEFLQKVWEETGLAAADTILGGFSQGAMLALDVGLRLKDPLMGIVAFSGGVIAPDTIGQELKSKPPVLLAHGAEDDVVPLSMSVNGAEALKKAGVDVELHISPGAGHTIAMDGLDRATGFIRRLMQGKPATTQNPH